MTRFLMAAIEQAKSVESNKLVDALESLRSRTAIKTSASASGTIN